MARHPRRPRVVGALALVLALLAHGGSTAEAYEVADQPEPVTTDEYSVSVILVYRDGSTARPVTERSSGGNGSPSCEYWLHEISTAAEAFEALGEPPEPGAVPYWLMCGSARIRPLWVTPDMVVDVDDVVRGEAQRYVETVLGPGLAMGVAPADFAVTGVPASFWVDGWDGAPIAVPPINPFGDTIDITLTLESVTWDFGDGTPSTAADLGVAPPATSSVRHNFSDRSTSPTAPDAAYTASATVIVAVTYRLNGGPDTPVTPPLTTTVTTPVIVREAQVVLG